MSTYLLAFCAFSLPYDEMCKGKVANRNLKCGNLLQRVIAIGIVLRKAECAHYSVNDSVVSTTPQRGLMNTHFFCVWNVF